MVQSGRRCRLQKRLTLPARRVPHRTRQHHIVLRHPHRSLLSLTSTDRTLSEQYLSRRAVTHSSVLTLQRIGALRDHRRLLKRPSENPPTHQPRILH